MTSDLSRRDLLATSARAGGATLAAGALAGAWSGVAASEAAASSKGYATVIALGVMAGPALTSDRKQPATALTVGDRIYLIDAGYDVVGQLRAAYLPFADLKHLFFTHHHSDHTAGYPALVALGAEHPQPIEHLDVWGPPPLVRMHADVLDFYAVDDASRQSADAPPLASKYTVHEFDLPATGAVTVLDDDLVRVSATRVFHGADVPNAYAYRFDIKRDGSSVVFSGDTAEPNANLIALMQGASLLVHEAMSIPGVDSIMGQIPPEQRAGLRRHLLESHTDVTDLPAIAKQAGVGHVALTHYTPYLPVKAWRKAFDGAARKVGYTGGVTPLDDLTTVAVKRAGRGRRG
jgi:ribonuclease BN (tRNA processing enzyme)